MFKTSQKSRFPRGRILRRLILSFSALVLALLLAEGALRLAGIPVEFNPEREVFGKLWFETVHRPSNVPGLDYELAPGLDIGSGKQRIRTNSMGFRAPKTKKKKPEGVFRVLVLGDSFTFAWGVKRERTYPALLENLLSSARSPKVEVINMGISGYGTKDEVNLLLNRGVPLEPDLVIVQYFLNDPDREPVQPLVAHYRPVKWWQHLNLTRLAYKWLWKRKVEKLGGGDYYRYLHNDPRSWSAVENSFAKLGRWKNRHDVPVLVVIFPALNVPAWPEYPYQDIHRQVMRAARTQGFATVDLYPHFKKYPESELTLPGNNFHPSAKAHEIAARRISEAIGDKLTQGRPDARPEKEDK
ncbi:MAG: SGNH/GDSL hydrolase family protein [bacterium]